MSDFLLAASHVDDDAFVDDAQMVSRLTSATILHFPLFAPHHPLMNLSHFLRFVHLSVNRGLY